MVLSNSLAHTFRLWMIFLPIAGLSGCAGYAVSFNDNPIYNPPTLFSDYQIADRALQECVQQSIEDQSVTEAAGLTQINCSSAGIASLEGLATFRGLKAINLSDNELQEAGELKSLSRLEIVMLKNNRLESIEPLLGLLRLIELDVRGNDNLSCGDAQQLAEHSEGEVHLPDHCRDSS